MVKRWSDQFNGFYECCGVNALGQACYHNTITFRLFTEGQLYCPIVVIVIVVVVY